MKKAFSVILAFILCLGMMQILPATAWAVGDTTPPKLISATLDKPEYTVGDKLKLTITYEEIGEMDIDACKFDISAAPEHEGSRRIFNISLNKGPEDNTLVGETNLTNLPSDTYRITFLRLKDLAGNEVCYFSGLPTFTFMNNTQDDWNGPTLNSVSMDKINVTVGDIITFEVHAEDLAGVSGGRISLHGVYNGVYPDIVLYPVDGQPGVLKGTFTVSDKLINGTYHISSIGIWDGLGNGKEYTYHPQRNPQEPPPVNTPPGMATLITINNPNVPPPPDTIPILKSFTISSERVKQGDPLTVRAEIDPMGQNLMYVGIGTGGKTGGGEFISLVKQEDGAYTGTFHTKPDWPVGEYVICQLSVSYLDNAPGVNLPWPNAKYDEYDNPICPTYHIDPIYSGTENVTLPLGSSFDPLAGVRAYNDTDGDMTDDIIVSGSVDTSKTGIYLIKYKIQSPSEPGKYYYDFRWVGVTDIQPEGQGAPLALSSTSLKVGAGSDEISIKKDGITIPYATSLSEKGNYEFQAKQPASTPGSFGATAPITYKSDKTSAMIDGTGPEITAIWQGTPATGITVKAAAKDPAHVEVMKWAEGTCTAPQFATGGTKFTGSFNVPTYGPYTIYARDGFGNESVRTYQISDGVLCGIGVSTGTFSEEFRHDLYKYTLYLDKDTPSVVITPQKTNASNTMTINGSRRASTTVKLNPGQSKKVTITVKQSSRKKVSYIVSVQRAADTNNTIASLSIKGGTVAPGTFDPSVSNYVVILPAKKSSASIRVKAASKYAKVYINDFRSTSRTVSVRKGQTKILDIKIVAQSGEQRKITITVIRLAK